jgi:hypothetical protein
MVERSFRGWAAPRRVIIAPQAQGNAAQKINVQADRNHSGAHAGFFLPAINLRRPSEETIAGGVRVQETDRLSGVGDTVLYRLHRDLWNWQVDLSILAVTAGSSYSGRIGNRAGIDRREGIK